MVSAAAFLLLGTGAAVVAAVDTTGNSISMNGSDTLYDVTQDVLAACSGATSNGIIYNGGGSGVGSFEMDQNNQQTSPMSRTLKNTEYCSVTPPGLVNATLPNPLPAGGIQQFTQDLVVGLDGIGFIASASSACGNANAGTTLNPSHLNGSFRVFVNGDGVTPATNCAGCDGGTNTYTVQDSLDVLRLLYGGMDHEATPTFNCGADARKSLVKQWSALFDAGCANCTGGLTHAWRRSDLSGTTDAFVSLVGFGARGIGTLATAPSPSKKTNPFCNSADAQGVNSITTSNGGSSDFVDNDPIRQPCATTDQVCQASGTLGTVLVVLEPDNRVNAPATTDTFPTVACGIGKFDLITSGNVHEKCPGGPNFLGDCFQPYVLQGTTHNYSCLSKSNAHAFGTPSGTDGRAWNLPLRVQASTGAYNLDANGREMTASFFRIHETSAAAGSTTTCQQPDDTSQIGCLTTADPCSVGYAGREGGGQPGASLLSLNEIPPTDPNIINLVSGGTPVYPLARRLYVASLVGFGNLIAGSGEAAFGACYANNNIVKPAMMSRHFVPMPSPGIGCLSYEDAPLPGCGVSPPVVTGCSDLPAGYITNPY